MTIMVTVIFIKQNSKYIIRRKKLRKQSGHGCLNKSISWNFCFR